MLPEIRIPLEGCTLKYRGTMPVSILIPICGYQFEFLFTRLYKAIEPIFAYCGFNLTVGDYVGILWNNDRLYILEPSYKNGVIRIVPKKIKAAILTLSVKDVISLDVTLHFHNNIYVGRLIRIRPSIINNIEEAVFFLPARILYVSPLLKIPSLIHGCELIKKIKTPQYTAYVFKKIFRN